MKRTVKYSSLAAHRATRSVLTAIALLLAFTVSAKVKKYISAKNVDTYLTEKYLFVTADLVLDSLKLKPNHQVLIIPVLQVASTPSTQQPDASATSEPKDSVLLPSVLVNGRNMHISYERGVLRNFPALKGHDIMMELKRDNGTKQTVEYVAKLPVEDWMKKGGTRVSFRYDACGCGVASAPEIYSVPVGVTMSLPEILETDSIFFMPEVNVPEVEVHAGKARIQFEVDRTALHVAPYTCRNGQRIDNRAELQVIDDSVKYALSDPNVELVGIDICGYASPESPYLHNVELADGRCMVLADYLAERYNLPRERVTYSYVPENWGEFREMVVASDELSETHRKRLLDLIDEPATTPEEYDRKETILKTDPRYSNIYKNILLPDWFPKLRATTFALKTQLKDMDDEKLLEVFRTTPGKMSLYQMCRVAGLYPADTDEFNDIVQTALAKYPNDPTAIMNAAIGAMGQKDFDRARTLLKNVEQTPEIFRMLAMMAEAEHDYAGAARYYKLAGDQEKGDEFSRKAETVKKLLDE